MNQTYHFKDWTSASKMRNEIDPDRRIEVGVLRSADREGIDGYQIRVYSQKTNKTIYQFYVDVGLPGTWCLTTREAIKALNHIGFPCEFEIPEYYNVSLSEDTKSVLTHLAGLGYTHIGRNTSPIEVYVYKDIPAKEFPTIVKHEPLSEVAAIKYNPHDFWFLVGPAVPIKGILHIDDEGEGEY